MSQQEAKLSIRGFGRAVLRNAKTGRIEGGTRFKNIVTEIGLRDFLVNQIHSDLSGSTIGFAAIGTATTAPVSTGTELNDEFETRKNVVGSLVASRTLRNTWSYATNEATQSSVGECGLFQTNTAGAMFSHATYTQSDKTTNQTLSFTYDIIFNTA